MRLRAIPYVIGTWLFLLGIVVQVFLAGMGLFELTDWTNHTNFGWLLGFVVVLLPVLALIARAHARTIAVTGLLALAGIIQPELALARLENPVLAALHPVNALFIFWLSWLVARASLRELWRVGSSTAAEAVTPSVADATTIGQDVASSRRTTI